tara:strand:+ start:497 stop:706 length:210 start_codon:yes stop_codon:yes gene_type:complete
MELIEILKQDKSDRAVIVEALENGYNASAIRRGLMEAYPLTCSDVFKANEIYESATNTLPIEFFTTLNR